VNVTVNIHEKIDVSVAAINQHIRTVYEDDELTQEATIKKFLIVQKEGERQIQCEVIHYNLQMIITYGTYNMERSS
jgi:hypothetical protein